MKLGTEAERPGGITPGSPTDQHASVGAGGGTVTQVNTTPPVQGGPIVGVGNISLNVTPANDGGAVAKQAASPGTQQIGSINLSGAIYGGFRGLFGSGAAALPAVGIQAHMKLFAYDTNLGVDFWSSIVIATKAQAGVGGGYVGGGLTFAYVDAPSDTLIKVWDFNYEIPNIASPSTSHHISIYDEIAGHLNRLDIDKDGSLTLPTTTGAFTPPKLTTTQRNALTPVSGMEINNTSVNRPQFWDGFHWRTQGFRNYRPEDYGGIADGKSNSLGNMTNGSPILTISGTEDPFTATDVGKAICVARAGAAGGILITTILSYTNPTQVTLNASASATVINAKVAWGTDNSTAFNAALTDAGISPTAGAKLELSFGTYLLTASAISGNQNIYISGQGTGVTRVFVGGEHAAFKFTNAGESQVVTDMKIEGMGSASLAGQTGIRWQGASTWHCGARNVILSNLGFPIYVDSTTNLYLQDVDIFEVGYNGNDGTGVACANQAAIFWVRGMIYTPAIPLIGTGAHTLSITSGTTALTTSDPVFSAMDIGKRIAIIGAGPAGATLITRINAVTSTTAATLANAASTTLTNAPATTSNKESFNACNIQANGGGYFMMVDLIGGQYGLLVNPGNGVNSSFYFFDNFLCDSQWNIGAYLAPTGTGTIRSMYFTHCWFASTGADQCGDPTNSHGIMIAGTTSNINDIRITGSRFYNLGGDALVSTGCRGLSVTNNDFDGAGGAKAADFIYLSGTQDVHIDDNRFSNALFPPATAPLTCIKDAGALTGTVSFQRNDGSSSGVSGGFLSALTSTPTANWAIRNNVSWNPRAMLVATPGVPGSTVGLQNTTGYDVTVYLNGGTISGATQIADVNGTYTSTGNAQTNTSFRLPAGGRIKLTYTVAPTWVWAAD